jgi:hypothetical protein
LIKDFNCKVDFWENGNEIINYLKSSEWNIVIIIKCF